MPGIDDLEVSSYVVRVGLVDHPVARLDLGAPEGDERCRAWGYAEKVVEVEPMGSPANFTFEGTDGDGFFQLAVGQAKGGLSGAPLVSPSRRGVVGVMTKTRDPSSDLGAWATPSSELKRLLDLPEGPSFAISSTTTATGMSGMLCGIT